MEIDVGWCHVCTYVANSTFVHNTYMVSLPAININLCSSLVDIARLARAVILHLLLGKRTGINKQTTKSRFVNFEAFL